MAVVRLLIAITTYSLAFILMSCTCSQEEQKEPDAITQVPSGITVQLDRLFYATNDILSVELDLSTLQAVSGPFHVIVANNETLDFEIVELQSIGGGRFAATDMITITDGSAQTGTPEDGMLALTAGEMLTATFLIDKNTSAFANFEENMVSDYAFGQADPAGTGTTFVEPELALTEDETAPAASDKQVGTLLPTDGWPVQIATQEVILFPLDDRQLEDFLATTGGRVLSSYDMVRDDPRGPQIKSYLIEVDPSTVPVRHLEQLRNIFEEDGRLLASRSEALSMYTFILFYKLEGYVLAANLRLQAQTEPQLTGSDAADVANTMRMIPARTTDTACIPGDPTRPCVLNVPAIWSYLAMSDRDERRINVAVLDMGFATNPDFRAPATGEMIECKISASLFGGEGGFRCEPGAAQGKPTVGNSFFGDKSWHGTGVVTVLGGVVGNDFGAAGVGGQVVVPSLYKFDAGSYAFEMGLAMRLATDQGASIINISAGYPCTILTNIGPDFGICSKAGRAAMCAEVVAAAAVTAAVICAVGTAVPILGPIACAISASSVIATTSACIAAYKFYGDLRGPMESGVRYAANAGVPVVTIAGNVANRDNLPPVLRDFIDIDDHRTERWQLMPAMAPEAIVVGATDNQLINEHYFGDRVDIWAPTASHYFAPEDTDDPASALIRDRISATSAAAPYITGVIAAMQAANPNLDRNSFALREACKPGTNFKGSGVGNLCRDITMRIKNILTDDANSFDNAELVAFGRENQPVERRRFVDGLSAVLAATRVPLPDMTAINQFRFQTFRSPVRPEPLLPDFIALGYDRSLNFSEILPNAAQDDPATAAVILLGETVTGTVVTLSPHDGTGAQVPADQDWFAMTLPGAQGQGRLVQVTATLTYPRVFGRPNLISDPDCFDIPSKHCLVRFQQGPTMQTPEENRDVYAIIGAAGETVHFAVTGDRSSDNVYRLTIDPTSVALSPDVQIIVPTAQDALSVCADELILFGAEANYPGLTGLPVAPLQIRWTVDGVVVPDAISLPSDPPGFHGVAIKFEPGLHAVQVMAYNDAALVDLVTVDARECTDQSPVVSIVSPADGTELGVEGTDPTTGFTFVDVTLTGIGIDPEDGQLPASALIWSTDRADIQAEALGTGDQISVRLFSDKLCSDVEHVILLHAVDSNGNPSNVARLVIRIKHQIC